MFSRGRILHSGEQISLQTVLQVDIWSTIKTGTWETKRKKKQWKPAETTDDEKKPPEKPDIGAIRFRL